jgi:beta-aspartyl-peptidase (threonine type)
MAIRLAGLVLVVVLALIAIGNLSPAEEPKGDDPVAKAVTKVLTTQAGHWNEGDIDGFMRYYWKSDDLTFSSGGTTRRGWDETMRRYREAYPTPVEMGKLTFSELEVRRLGDTAALVLGRWALERDQEPVKGNFSLVMEKIDGEWLVTHDHTSRQAAE